MKSSMVESGNELSGDIRNSSVVKCVKMNVIRDGVEIVICSGFHDCSSSSPLSDLMEIIVEEGCDVVNCVTNQVNGKTFHTIKSEVHT